MNNRLLGSPVRALRSIVLLNAIAFLPPTNVFAYIGELVEEMETLRATGADYLNTVLHTPAIQGLTTVNSADPGLCRFTFHLADNSSAEVAVYTTANSVKQAVITTSTRAFVYDKDGGLKELVFIASYTDASRNRCVKEQHVRYDAKGLKELEEIRYNTNGIAVYSNLYAYTRCEAAISDAGIETGYHVMSTSEDIGNAAELVSRSAEVFLYKLGENDITFSYTYGLTYTIDNGMIAASSVVKNGNEILCVEEAIEPLSLALALQNAANCAATVAAPASFDISAMELKKHTMAPEASNPSAPDAEEVRVVMVFPNGANNRNEVEVSLATGIVREVRKIENRYDTKERLTAIFTFRYDSRGASLGKVLEYLRYGSDPTLTASTTWLYDGEGLTDLLCANLDQYGNKIPTSEYRLYRSRTGICIGYRGQYQSNVGALVIFKYEGITLVYQKTYDIAYDRGGTGEISRTRLSDGGVQLLDVDGYVDLSVMAEMTVKVIDMANAAASDTFTPQGLEFDNVTFDTAAGRIAFGVNPQGTDDCWQGAMNISFSAGTGLSLAAAAGGGNKTHACRPAYRIGPIVERTPPSPGINFEHVRIYEKSAGCSDGPDNLHTYAYSYLLWEYDFYESNNEILREVKTSEQLTERYDKSSRKLQNDHSYKLTMDRGSSMEHVEEHYRIYGDAGLQTVTPDIVYDEWDIYDKSLSGTLIYSEHSLRTAQKMAGRWWYKDEKERYEFGFDGFYLKGYESGFYTMWGGANDWACCNDIAKTTCYRPQGVPSSVARAVHYEGGQNSSLGYDKASVVEDTWYDFNGNVIKHTRSSNP
jgi:hypothetical protein